jgi:hypothetical protein
MDVKKMQEHLEGQEEIASTSKDRWSRNNNRRTARGMKPKRFKFKYLPAFSLGGTGH